MGLIATSHARAIRRWLRPGPPQPFPYILTWAVLMHLSWGVALFADRGTAALVILVGLHWVTALSLSGETVGAALVAISLMAALSLALGTRLSNRAAILMILPQQAVLMAALLSDLQTLVTGNVTGQAGDQQSVDRLLLFAILAPIMIAAVLHSAAVVDRHSTWTERAPWILLPH